MTGHAIIRWCAVAGLLITATSNADARTRHGDHGRADLPGVMDQNATPQISKIITLNFGPLHFQEIVRSAPLTCPSSRACAS